MLTKITNFLHYLMGKTSELGDLEKKDVLLSKVVLDIHRKRTHTDFVSVPLFQLHQIHAIDRENAMAATARRIAELEKIKTELLEEKNITREILAEYLPSVSWIKVVQESDASFIAYEGNGRLVALQKVFTPDDNIQVEVEQYFFHDSEKILKRMNRIRHMNGLVKKS
ncbi:hypothetical protein [Desulfogranum japonicum]|uniref:hypothetical protein n=1 Tax=Desulfogranum japonicum TaxID=231447 RepID=UPI00040C45A1|nr:hypothetical protein [Desulfogranum japonicum]